MSSAGSARHASLAVSWAFATGLATQYRRPVLRSRPHEPGGDGTARTPRSREYLTSPRRRTGKDVDQAGQ